MAHKKRDFKSRDRTQRQLRRMKQEWQLARQQNRAGLHRVNREEKEWSTPIE